MRISWAVCILVAYFGIAPARAGCEYVQSGPTAGDFFLDCVGSTPGVPVDPNPDSYLAIALSPQLVAGAGWGPNQQATEQRAIAQCQSHGGQGCRVVRSYHNMCASVAVSNPHKIIAIEEMRGQGWNGAEMARRKCTASGGQACRELITACANGYVSPIPWVPSGRGDGSYKPATRRR